ncbi:MAG: bifunctional nuclease family protein [Muribaculaceae bacterium]|nr:bifunctional nuclease family protein [Muribaculaceae bacterium]
MENRVRLHILGLSYSQIQTGAYALILAEDNGPRRIPVVIGASEAQSIAIKMEGVIPPRPMTHDLFVSFAHGFGVTLREVFIYKFQDGIFYSELTFSDGDRQIVLDSRTSDAIAIAIRSKSPIYTTRKILEETGFVMNTPDENDDTDDQDGESTETFVAESTFSPDVPIERFTIEELERTLAHCIENEDYEEAARVSEIIRRKKEDKENRDNDEAEDNDITGFDL